MNKPTHTGTASRLHLYSVTFTCPDSPLPAHNRLHVQYHFHQHTHFHLSSTTFTITASQSPIQPHLHIHAVTFTCAGASLLQGIDEPPRPSSPLRQSVKGHTASRKNHAFAFYNVYSEQNVLRLTREIITSVFCSKIWVKTTTIFASRIYIIGYVFVCSSLGREYYSLHLLSQEHCLCRFLKELRGTRKENNKTAIL